MSLFAMERKDVEIWRPTDSGQEKIGCVSFDENITSLDVRATALNVDLKIPSEIKLSWPRESELAPMLNNLRATINLKLSTQQTIEVGTVRDDDYYLATKAPETIRQAGFIWKDALAGLIFIENHRTSDSPTLEIELLGELSYAVKCKRWFPRDVIMMDDVAAMVLTPPFQRVRGRVELRYKPEVWRQMIDVAFEASIDSPLLITQPLIPFLRGDK
jgi:hypothetical protein